MGNEASKPYWKLSQVIPGVNSHGLEDDKWVDKKIFRNDADREQFIFAVLSVISHNGKIKFDLPDYQFKLLFSRKPNDRFVATLVAMRGGVIEAKIESTDDGKTQAEAFRAFKKHVEERLHELLESVPDVGAMSPVPGPSSASRQSTLPSRSIGQNQPSSGQDLPPAYENGSQGFSTAGKKS